MCARFTVLSDAPIAAAIAGCVIPLSRNSTIRMRWRCAAGIFHRSAVFSRRTSALLHLTICFPRIRLRKRITPRPRKTIRQAVYAAYLPRNSRFKPFWRWYEMLYCAKWVQRLLLAEHYLQSRVFIAGDAAHLALLQSYEAERRPIGAINVKASGGGTAGRMKWRAAYRPNIEDDTPSGRAALANLLAIAKTEAPKSFRVIGAELGYRYAGSSVICDEPG